MNLLLLRAFELDADGRAELGGRRARHLLEVLRVEPGRRVRAGVLDGPLGWAEVFAIDPARVRVAVRCELQDEAPPAGRDVLLLAVPRPKVLLRCLELATALGFGRIALFRCWRVDKSHLRSRALDPATHLPRLCAGLELARRTRLPEVSVFPLFKPFVEDRCDGLAPRGNRFVAHPDAGTDTAALEPWRGPRPFTLAIGPERGFTDFEVSAFEKLDFVPVRAGAHPLRVEAALAVLAGQLDLLRRRGDGRALSGKDPSTIGRGTPA